MHDPFPQHYGDGTRCGQSARDDRLLKWEVIEASLQSVQGKPIVNSISLKEGEEIFIRTR